MKDDNLLLSINWHPLFKCSGRGRISSVYTKWKLDIYSISWTTGITNNWLLTIYCCVHVTLILAISNTLARPQKRWICYMRKQIFMLRFLPLVLDVLKRRREILVGKSNSALFKIWIIKALPLLQLNRWMKIIFGHQWKRGSPVHGWEIPCVGNSPKYRWWPWQNPLV